MYHIFPEPKQVTFSSELTSCSSNLDLSIAPALAQECREAGFMAETGAVRLFSACPPDGQTRLTIAAAPMTADVTRESFSLSIKSHEIRLSCVGAAGIFYGYQVIAQLLDQCQGLLPVLELTDQPSLSIRGVILDIGRNKIPSMQTLRELLTTLSQLRINHLQLYMEGFCFDYPQHRYLFTDETPMTAGEFQELDAYARAHFIELVPNQNVLGHMESFLEKPQYNMLAECEEGFLFQELFWRPPMTLDVYDDNAFQMATTMLDTLLPNFSSDYVNVNMDEPFEMGHGKNADTARKQGRMKLYFDYLHKLAKYCHSKGKKMMIWGDEILQNPESVSLFPKDAVLLDWIYEGDASFKEHAQLLEKTGLKYCLCPGTSCWASFTGRSDNMKKNIADAAYHAIEHHAQGIITTDWGDLGHWQYQSASYPGFACTGLYGWSGTAADDTLLPWYCDQYLYQCEPGSGSAYQAACDLGNYYLLEEAPIYSTTLSFSVMSRKYTFSSIAEFDEKIELLLTLSANLARLNQIPPQDPVIKMNYEQMQDYLNNVAAQLNRLSLKGESGNLITAEMRNGLRLIRHGTTLYHVMTELRDTPDEFAAQMKLLFEDLDAIMKTHYALWMKRNRSGGFAKSTAHMLHLLNFYKKHFSF